MLVTFNISVFLDSFTLFLQPSAHIFFTKIDTKVCKDDVYSDTDYVLFIKCRRPTCFWFPQCK